MATIAEVKQALMASDEAVRMAVIMLSGEQEVVEKLRRDSIYVNDRGFRKQHGCLVVYAEKALEVGLSKDEIAFLRPRMFAYAGQLGRLGLVGQQSLLD